MWDDDYDYVLQFYVRKLFTIRTTLSIFSSYILFSCLVGKSSKEPLCRINFLKVILALQSH